MASETVPSKYSLYSYDGYVGSTAGYEPNVGDQKSTDLCWAFASNTALESALYKSEIVDYRTMQLNFSEADIAYYAYSSRGLSTLGSGHFSLAYEYYASENGPVEEQSWEKSLNWGNNDLLFSTYKSALEQNGKIMSNYSVLESYSFQSRYGITKIDSANGVEKEVTNAKILALRDSIKEHIFTRGAVTASVNIDDYISNLNVLYGETVKTNHLVALVGWDDNFTYSSHKGAYIAQNSYGVGTGNEGYFYIMYDDVNVENQVEGFIRVGEKTTNKHIYSSTSGSEYQDRFLEFSSAFSTSGPLMSVTAGSKVVSQATYFANIFRITSDTKQVIDEIKIPTVSVCNFDNGINNAPSTFEISVATLSESDFADIETGLKNSYDSSIKVKNATNDSYQFVAQQTGYYAINVEEEIVLDKSSDYKYFVVFIKQLDGSSLIINNNSNGEISLPTYTSFLPTNDWQEYGDTDKNGFYSTVLPMIVSTTAKEKIDYVVQNASFEYDGQAHNPVVDIKTSGDFSVEYSLDKTNWAQSLNIKDVLIQDGAVANYKVYIKISGYIFKNVIDNCDLTITPKPLTVTPNSASKTYGDKDPTFTQQVTGFLASEDDFSTRYRLTREQGENAGEYNILRGNFDVVGSSTSKFKRSNYTINFVENVKFTINKRIITIIPTTLSKIYGESNPANYNYEFRNVVTNETPNSDIVLDRVSALDGLESENVGKYNFFIRSGGLLDNGAFLASNYVVQVDSSRQFEIKKRALTITPDTNQSKKLYATDPILTYSFENAVHGEVPSFLGKLSRTVGENAGEYDILVGSLTLKDNGAFLANNYYIDFVSGVKFFISYGDIENVDFIDKSITYSGGKHYLDYAYSGEGLSVQYSLDGENFSSERLEFKDCGEYVITAKFSKKNYYDLIKTATLTITKKDLFVIPNGSQSAIYGEELRIAYVFSGEASGEIPNFVGTLDTDNHNVGLWTIKKGDLSLQDNGEFLANNYNLVFINSENYTLEITKRDIYISPLSSNSKKYGTSDPVLKYEVENGVIDDADLTDNACFEGALTRENLAKNDVGTYDILQGTLKIKESTNAFNNYNLIFRSGKKFTINKAPVTIRLNNVECFYGNTISLSSGSQKTNYTVTNGTIYYPDELGLNFVCFENGVQVEISNTSRRSSDPTGYLLTATANNGNYDVTVLDARYVIKYVNYDVTFVVGEGMSTTQVEQFSSPKELPKGLSTTAVTGYELSGWSNNLNDSILTTDDIFNYEVMSNITFTAQFTPISYSLTFILNGGELAGENMLSYTIEDNLSLPTATKNGYNFVGFYLTDDFSSERIEKISRGNTGNKTFYAKFERKTYVVNFKPLETASSATILGQANVKFGDSYNFSVTLSNAYTKSYDSLKAIISWENSSIESVVATKTIENEKAVFEIDNVLDAFSVEISGIEINSYDISFYADSIKVGTVTKKYGETLTTSEYPTIPVKKHFDESAWEQTEDVVIYNDQVINAVYTPNTYKVTFVLDGKSYDVDVVYGSKADTTVLNQNRTLGAFEYFKFNKSIDNISGDEVIEVTVGSNAFILYIVLGVIVASAIAVVILNIIRQRRRRKFAWWVFGK